MDNLCKKCKGRGWILHTDANGYEFATECECQEIQKTYDRLKRSGISEEFLKKGFNDFDDRGLEILQKAKSMGVAYCKNFPDIRSIRNNSILFMGQVGSGKTHLSMAICNNLMNVYKVGVLYMPYREEVLRLKQLTNDASEYKHAIKRFKEFPVLMIDDLMKGKSTEADINVLFEIVNYRYLNNLPMIISTEKTKKELLEFDEGTMSRIIEMAKGYTIEIIGSKYNYRLRE